MGYLRRVNQDSNRSVKCVHTTQQIADLFLPKKTNGPFTRDKCDELMILFGIVPESYHRSQFSVFATLVLSAQQMARKSRPFTDEASKYTGASSKSMPVGWRVLALAAVRHEKSSPSISDQEKEQSDVKVHVNRSQASTTDCISHQESRSHGTRSVRFGKLLPDAKKEKTAECIVVIWTQRVR